MHMMISDDIAKPKQKLCYYSEWKLVFITIRLILRRGGEDTTQHTLTFNVSINGIHFNSESLSLINLPYILITETNSLDKINPLYADALTAQGNPIKIRRTIVYLHITQVWRKVYVTVSLFLNSYTFGWNKNIVIPHTWRWNLFDDDVEYVSHDFRLVCREWRIRRKKRQWTFAGTTIYFFY